MEITAARVGEIAFAYLVYRSRIEGVPDFNNPEFEARLRRILEEPEFVQIGLTLDEAKDVTRQACTRALERPT